MLCEPSATKSKRRGNGDARRRRLQGKSELISDVILSECVIQTGRLGHVQNIGWKWCHWILVASLSTNFTHELHLGWLNDFALWLKGFTFWLGDCLLSCRQEMDAMLKQARHDQVAHKEHFLAVQVSLLLLGGPRGWCQHYFIVKLVQDQGQ